MNAHNFIELTIQRLVDNQLDAPVRRTFLTAAESRPELWRRIALAFVEEQVWKSAIPQASGDPPPASSPGLVAPVSPSLPHESAPAASPAQNGRFSLEYWQASRPEPGEPDIPAYLKDTAWLKPSPGGSPNRSWRIGPAWLALAATLMLVATIAIRLVTLGDNDARTPISHADQPEERVTAFKPYMLQVGDDLQVPVYEEPAPMRDHLARFGSSLDPELVEMLRDSGFELQSQLRYMSGRSPDGTSVIYPVHQVHIQSAVQ